MGNNESQYSSNILETKKIKKDLAKMIKNNNIFHLYEFLDLLKEREGTVDFYYEKNMSLLYLIIISKIENKYDILKRLIRDYDFDLNKNINLTGNILTNLILNKKIDKKIIELLIENKINMNEIINNRFTILDIIGKNDSLYDYLKSYNAKHYVELYNLNAPNGCN